MLFIHKKTNQYKDNLYGSKTTHEGAELGKLSMAVKPEIRLFTGLQAGVSNGREINDGSSNIAEALENFQKKSMHCE